MKKGIELRAGCDVDSELETVMIEDGYFRFVFSEAADYGIPVDNAFDRVRMAEDGFLYQYYTRKGAYLLIAGFGLQLLDSLLPLL